MGLLGGSAHGVALDEGRVELEKMFGGRLSEGEGRNQTLPNHTRTPHRDELRKIWELEADVHQIDDLRAACQSAFGIRTGKEEKPQLLIDEAP
jgi:hypothetical protein